MTEDPIIPDPRPDLVAAVTQLTQQPGADTVDFTDLDGIIGAGGGNLEAVRAVVAELKQQHPDLDYSDIDQIIGAGGGNLHSPMPRPLVRSRRASTAVVSCRTTSAAAMNSCRSSRSCMPKLELTVVETSGTRRSERR